MSSIARLYFSPGSVAVASSTWQRLGLGCAHESAHLFRSVRRRRVGTPDIVGTRTSFPLPTRSDAIFCLPNRFNGTSSRTDTCDAANKWRNSFLKNVAIVVTFADSRCALPWSIVTPANSPSRTPSQSNCDSFPRDDQGSLDQGSLLRSGFHASQAWSTLRGGGLK
jgi:hypothetical protein